MIDASQPIGARRRSLLITRDYPPVNTPGALRPLKFAKYLPEFGWDTSIVTTRPAGRTPIDPSLLGEILPGSRVYRTFGFDTQATLSVGGRYPGFLALPDRWISWLPSAVLRSIRVVRLDRITSVISTGPPPTAHCIGLLVRRFTGLPWVADFRDPWLSQQAAAVQRRLERRVVLAADRLVVTTEGIGQELRERYGAAADGKIQVVYNGYDEEDFERVPAPDVASSDFTIAHLGYIYNPERNPDSFLAALRHALDRGDVPVNTSVAFVAPGGPAVQQNLAALLRTFRLEGCVRILDPIPHRDALAIMLRSSVLLLLQGGVELRQCIPSKAFEYLRSNRIILTLAPPGSETAQLMNQFDGAFLANPRDPADVAEKLAAACRSWRSGTPPERRSQDLGRYTRRASARRLAEILDGLCNG